MATSKEYRDFILERLSFLDDILLRPMMGEYLLYYKDLLIGGLYDDRVLIKISPNNHHLKKEVPYEGAKKMYLLDEWEDIDVLRQIIEDTYFDLFQKRGEDVRE